ncbi:MAG: hypothetical protein QOE97_2562, partial [Pseudonocardiales bacterium]|nr:hypothetical protein [Pseudonocardiales bacterium]
MEIYEACESRSTGALEFRSVTGGSSLDTGAHAVLRDRLGLVAGG